MSKHIPILRRISVEILFSNVAELYVLFNRSFIRGGFRINLCQITDLLEHFGAIGEGKTKNKFDDFGAKTLRKGVPVIVRGFSNSFAAETEEAAGSHFGWIENCVGELKGNLGWMMGAFLPIIGEKRLILLF